MINPQAILFTTAITVGLAGTVAYGLFRAITIKGEATRASDYGRKWLAWMVVIGTMSTLPKFFRLLDVDSFVTWIIDIVFFGLLAFVVGWLYGKVFRTKTRAGKPDRGASSSTS